MDLDDSIDPTAGVAIQVIAMSEQELEAYQLGFKVGRLNNSQRAMIAVDHLNLVGEKK